MASTVSPLLPEAVRRVFSAPELPNLEPRYNHAATMSVAAGFDTGFSFFYASVGFAGSVTVYDGLNGTGSILAALDLTALGSGCAGDPNGDNCAWAPVGVIFAGTARSVDFGGGANKITFDNITLGAATPGVSVPEPGERR